MMRWIRSYLFEYLADLYPRPTDHYRARALIMIDVSLLVVLAVLVVIRLFSGAVSPSVTDEGLGNFFAYIAPISAVMILTVVLVHNGRLLWAKWMWALMLYTAGLFLARSDGVADSRTALLLAMPLVTALMFGLRGVLLGTLASMGIVIFAGVAEVAGLFPPNLEPYTQSVPINGMLVLNGLLILVGMILWLFSSNIQTSLSHAERAAHQLQIIGEIVQTASNILKLESLLPRLVNMIHEMLGYEHVQIFMLDETGKNAVLVASTGQAGRQLLAQGHSLVVGSRSVIGQATGRGETIYAADTERNPMHQRNELLANTRSELALPLRDGDRIVGALDVQSVHVNAFSIGDIDVLQILASQITGVIRNTQLIERTQTSAEENRRLFDEAQANLREIERLNRQLTGQAWEDYFVGRGREVGALIEGANLRRTADWTPALAEAAQQGQPASRDDGEIPVVAVPIDLRGQVVGAVEVALPPGTPREDAVDLIQGVAHRLALSIDNARLFEEAQTLARHEQTLNSIGGQLQGVTEVDEMLRLALTELQQALDAERASIRLRPVAPTGNGHEH